MADPISKTLQDCLNHLDAGRTDAAVNALCVYLMKINALESEIVDIQAPYGSRIAVRCKLPESPTHAQ
jgi:hypothetical protein